MQKTVADANIIFAAIIREEITRRILFCNNLLVYVPEHIFVEIEKYRDEMILKTGKRDDDFEIFMSKLFRLVKPVPFLDFYDCLPHARKICPDKNDVMYFALAMKLKCPIWSNDRKLKEQKFVRVYSTEDMLALRL